MSKENKNIPDEPVSAEDNIIDEASFKEMLSFEPDDDKSPEADNAALTEQPPDESKAEPLDALDRDLAEARQKKEIEQRELDEKLRKEKELEEIRLEKARQAQENAARREERAKALEKKKRQEEKSLPKPQIAVPYTPEKDTAFGIGLIRGITAFVVVLGVAYAGGLIYTRSLNDEFIKSMERDLMGISAAGESAETEYDYSRDKLSADEKQTLKLSEFLPDSDKDGLSDHYEINVSGTDPANRDSDGDGIPDGAEIYAGLDPLTADDESVPVSVRIETDGAYADIEGTPRNATATIDKVTNNSITGAAGIIGSPYEFYTAYAMQSCKLTISYTDEMAEKWDVSPDGIFMYKFDSDDLSFKRLDSFNDKEAKTVSADIDSIGIYALGAGEYVEKEQKSRIFFLIDNSGSMYPEEQCPGSEENDVNFKRLDFASDVIDTLGDKAEYGAAQFTGTYTKLSSVTSDREAVKTQIDGVRTSDTFFDGTDIAGAVSAAAKELGNDPDDKNYIILLTDGYPTDSTPEKEAEALEILTENNITVFTIGLGKRIDADYLSNMSETASGQYYQVSNASALERICGKIDSFMSYNKTAVTPVAGEENIDVYIIADSGFNADKDSMAYNNFRTDFSETGTDYGIAELTRRYFTGELELKAEGYKNSDGEDIPGYDLSGIEQLADGKPDLVDLKINFLENYNKYLAIENKWDYHSSSSGLLKYNSNAQDFILNNNMTVSVMPYTVKLPDLDRWIEMLQKITFQKLPEFSSYECAVLNSTLHEGNDKAMLDAFRYMQNIHNCTEKTDVYDFGYDGKQAYEYLRTELSMGNPVVISAGGAALNAVRLMRESENTNKLILEAYDCNKPGVVTYISILRTPVYDGGKTPYYQYSASVDGKDVPLLLYITKK